MAGHHSIIWLKTLQGPGTMYAWICEMQCMEMVGWSSPEETDKLCTCTEDNILPFPPFAKAWNCTLCLHKELKNRNWEEEFFLPEAKSLILNIWTSKHQYPIPRVNESQAWVQILPHANQTSATIKSWIMSLKPEVWVIHALIHSGIEKRECSLKNIHHPQWIGVFALPSNCAASLHLWDPWVKTQCQHKSLRVQSGLWHINIDEEKRQKRVYICSPVFRSNMVINYATSIIARCFSKSQDK